MPPCCSEVGLSRIGSEPLLVSDADDDNDGDDDDDGTDPCTLTETA